MKKTWRPIVAGLLMLVSSVPYLVASFGLLKSPPTLPEDYGGGQAWAPVGLIIWMPFALPLLVGGVAALMRKAWGLAIIGASLPLVLVVILSPWRSTDVATAPFFQTLPSFEQRLIVIPVYVMMVAAIVLLAFSRKEFTGRKSSAEHLYGPPSGWQDNIGT